MLHISIKVVNNILPGCINKIEIIKKKILKLQENVLSCPENNFFFFVKHVWNIFLTGFVRYTQCLLLVSIIKTKLNKKKTGWLFYKSENGRFLSIIIYNVQILATIRKSG